MRSDASWTTVDLDFYLCQPLACDSLTRLYAEDGFSSDTLIVMPANTPVSYWSIASVGVPGFNIM